MQCKKMTVTREELLDPVAPAWNGIPGEALTMDATPLANQPSEYIKASRDARQIGKVKNLMVQAVHNGTDILFRLTWRDALQNVEITGRCQCTDGCGILMPPSSEGAARPWDEMAIKDGSVNARFWRGPFKD